MVCGPTQVKNKKVKMMFKVYNVVYSSFIIFFLDWIKSFQRTIMETNINDHCEISNISDKLLWSKLQRFKDAAKGNDLG